MFSSACGAEVTACSTHLVRCYRHQISAHLTWPDGEPAGVSCSTHSCCLVSNKCCFAIYLLYYWLLHGAGACVSAVNYQAFLIALGVIVAIVGLIMVVVCLYCCCCRGRLRERTRRK
jgi:hypothetical protein